MKIKEYLNILGRLPQMPHYKHTVECGYLDGDRVLSSDGNNSFNKLRFTQTSYCDNTSRVKYKWEEISGVEIDYEVETIYIKSKNKMVFAKLIELTYTYGFKCWGITTSNMDSCYIDFYSKTWLSIDSRCDEFCYIDDESIVEKIFYSSVKEYPNGIPLIWVDL